ncbi:phosphatase PAP2 family protein [Friedmanniella luteola]|uniref:phosphatase PAP2 family protein n=1 Tax=Friedmanniella luteola TaxID=546871 RepID=UPI0012FDF31C|nr:phosphatase PAP2 family protein [Friedmanniella luteola]
MATTSVPTFTLRPSAAGWAATGFVLLYLLSVGTAGGQRLDEAAMQWTAASVTEDGWAEALLTGVSGGSVLLVGGALAIVTALARGLRAGALGALSGAVVLLAAEVLKLTLARPDFTVQALANSFPSGHVAAVTGLALALLLAAPAGRWRWAALLAVTPAVALTGLATIALEWHRPSDVLGSVLLGVVIGATAAGWESRTVGRAPAGRSSSADPRVSRSDQAREPRPATPTADLVLVPSDAQPAHSGISSST